MRISSTTLSNLTTKSVNSAYTNYAEIMQKINTNKNFTKMSEDPVAGRKILKIDNQLAQLNEYQSNIDTAVDEMNLTYDTLNQVTDQLNAIDNLVVEAANGTTNKTTLNTISDEIEQRVATIADKMNTKYMENYIFSGTYTDTRTYEQDASGKYVYNGSSEKGADRNLTISENTTFAYNVSGEEIFGKSGDTTEFFSQMKELCDLLQAEPTDYDAIREKLNVIQDTSDNVAYVTGNVSSAVARLETTKELNDDTITNLTANKADIQEVDITKAATDLANAQTALQASYLLNSQVLEGATLLDYI